MSRPRRAGILLAGGKGTRLRPLTDWTSKQLLPVYDKPMVYYPLTTLLLAGIEDLLLVSDPAHLDHYRTLLGDGRRFGIRISYAAQDRPRGIADAFRVGAGFLDGRDVALMLGDNILHGPGLGRELARAWDENPGATIFGYPVADPTSYGVAAFDAEGNVTGIIEKPSDPPSDLAIPGLYLFRSDVVEKARTLEPSQRGELEITDLNNQYLAEARLRLIKLGRGIAWLDGGTPRNLLEAAQFVAVLQERQGLLVGCPEEVAFLRGLITRDDLERAQEEYADTDYGNYLRRLASGRI